MNLRHSAWAAVGVLSGACLLPSCAQETDADDAPTATSAHADALTLHRPDAVAPKEEQDAMRTFLRGRADPSDIVRSFTTPDGLVYDCYPFDKQPGARLAKENQAPVYDHPVGTPGAPASRDPSPQRVAVSAAVPHADACPDFTVPIARLSLDELAGYPSLQAFHAKVQDPHPATGKVLHGRRETPEGLPTQVEAPWSDGYAHEYAIQRYTRLAVTRATDRLTVYAPAVESGLNEFSLSQLWVVSFAGNDNTQTLEAGWQVYPNRQYQKEVAYCHTYPPDSRCANGFPVAGWNLTIPHFFIYSTADGYRSRMGYDTENGVFVQTNSSVTLGDIIPFSTHLYLSQLSAWDEGCFLTVTYTKDGANNWWLYYTPEGATSPIQVGYYPAWFFNIPGVGTSGLITAATTIDVGGEIVNTWPGGRHTRTQMGDGQFPVKGMIGTHPNFNQRTAEHKVARWPQFPSTVRAEQSASSTGCYDLHVQGPSWTDINKTDTLSFGGIGYGPTCP